MIRVKSFTTALRVFHAKEELENLDKKVNEFLDGNQVEKVFSVSDTCTTDNTGATIGIVRVVTYQAP